MKLTFSATKTASKHFITIYELFVFLLMHPTDIIPGKPEQIASGKERKMLEGKRGERMRVKEENGGRGKVDGEEEVSGKENVGWR